MEYKSLQDYVKVPCKTKNMDYIAIWRSMFCLEVVGVTDYSNILKLAEFCPSFAIANAKSEAGFSHVKRVENSYRNQLGEEPLLSLMRMVIDGNRYAEHNSTKAAEALYNKKIGRKLPQNESNLATRAPMKIQNQKKSKKDHSAQKSLFQLAGN